MADTREILTGICKGWNSQGGSAHCDKGHLWRWATGVGGEPPELGSPCPVCAEIKARGEEVLKLVRRVCRYEGIDYAEDAVTKAYHVKHGGK